HHAHGELIPKLTDGRTHNPVLVRRHMMHPHVQHLSLKPDQQRRVEEDLVNDAVDQLGRHHGLRLPTNTVIAVVWTRRWRDGAHREESDRVSQHTTRQVRRPAELLHEMLDESYVVPGTKAVDRGLVDRCNINHAHSLHSSLTASYLQPTPTT